MNQDPVMILEREKNHPPNKISTVILEFLNTEVIYTNSTVLTNSSVCTNERQTDYGAGMRTEAGTQQKSKFIKLQLTPLPPKKKKKKVNTFSLKAVYQKGVSSIKSCVCAGNRAELYTDMALI